MISQRRPLAIDAGPGAWPDFEASGKPAAAARRIYAIGDLHGYSDLLRLMQQAIGEDLKRHPADRVLIVFLGDLIDRGPDSFGTVEALIRATEASDDKVETICLRGNHDDWLANFLTDPTVLPRWAIKGGLETLLSYGLAQEDILAGAGDPERAVALQSLFLAAIPDRHKDFMLSLPLSHGDGDYLFVHAGIDPDRSLDDQRIEDLTWIRDKFLLSRKDFGKVVVHGHTVRPAVESLPNRINVDTGAYLRQVLSCVILDGAERHLLEVAADPSRMADLTMEASA